MQQNVTHFAKKGIKRLETDKNQQLKEILHKIPHPLLKRETPSTI